MSEKKIDMFKLVEQVEKQKKMDIDDIFSNLDSVKNEEIKVEEVKAHEYTSVADPAAISRPRIPNMFTMERRMSTLMWKGIRMLWKSIMVMPIRIPKTSMSLKPESTMRSTVSTPTASMRRVTMTDWHMSSRP